MSLDFSQEKMFMNSKLFSEESYWELSDDRLYLKASEDQPYSNSFQIRLIEDSLLVLDKVDEQIDWNFVRAKNFSDFFSRMKGVQLEQMQDSGVTRLQWFQSFNIYLSIKNGETNVSTDFSDDIEAVNKDLEQFRKSLATEFQESFNIFLFIDRNFPANQWEIFTNDLVQRYPDRVYRIFSTQIPDVVLDGIFWNSKMISLSDSIQYSEDI
jgi:hypothetical protein